MFNSNSSLDQVSAWTAETANCTVALTQTLFWGMLEYRLVGKCRVLHSVWHCLIICHMPKLFLEAVI